MSCDGCIDGVCQCKERVFMLRDLPWKYNVEGDFHEVEAGIFSCQIFPPNEVQLFFEWVFYSEIEKKPVGGQSNSIESAKLACKNQYFLFFEPFIVEL